MIFELHNRYCIKIIGEDAVTFLNGIVTNDVRKAIANKMIYALMLTPQGKLLYDFFIIKIDDGFLLDIATQYQEEIIKKLQMYRLRAKVDIIECSQYHTYASFNKIDGFMPDPRNGALGYRCVSHVHFDSCNDLIEYEIKRISLKIVDIDLDIKPGQFFPFELNMGCAIDYQKGCYVGQEVIARTHYKGVVRKGVYVINIISGSIQPHSDMTMNGNKIGEALGFVGDHGLAILRHEAVEAQDSLTLDTCVLTIA